MNLPVITAPHYTLILPSSGETIYFRPFLVKEESLLLMTVDLDEDQQIRTLRQVLNNCILADPLTGKKLNLDKMAMFDLDYVWLKIRSRSVEEIVKLPFECRAKLPEGQTREDSDGNIVDHCGNVVLVPVNLDKIEVKKNPENNPIVTLHEDIGVKMRYPTFEIVQKLAKLKTNSDFQSMFECIMECIDCVFQGNTTYEREHIEKGELQTFLEALSQAQFAKIMNFFDTLPSLRHEIHFRCTKCKHEVDIILEGTKSFLASDSATTV